MPRNQLTQQDPFPFPFNTDTAEADVSFADDGRVQITFKIDREAMRGVMDRWTWNSATITIRSGDRDIVLQFPKIEEKVARRF